MKGGQIGAHPLLPEKSTLKTPSVIRAKKSL